jgi:hypothetical protein
VAVYGTSDPLAAAPTPNPWLKLAQRLLPGPTAAYACASYTSPAVWVQGFVTLDIKKVMCDYNGDGTWDSHLHKTTAHPDSSQLLPEVLHGGGGAVEPKLRVLRPERQLPPRWSRAIRT